MFLSLLLACSKQPDVIETPGPPPPPPAAKAIASDWPVSGSVGVVTIKNGDAPVRGTLDGVSGQVTVTGDWSGVDGQVAVDLSTWDSALALRDDRIKETFFDLAAHGTATFAVARLEGVPEGGPSAEGSPVTVTGRLGLHGTEQEVVVAATLTPAGEGFRLVTTEGFDVGMASYGLEERLQALLTLCGHASVDDTAKVSLDLALGSVPAPSDDTTEEGAGGEGEAPAAPTSDDGGS